MTDGFIDIQREVKLPQEEVDYLLNNPEGLTKEGAEYNFKQWKKSNNKYVIEKYRIMLEKCKNFSKSGLTTDGRTILARIDDKVVWTEKLD